VKVDKLTGEVNWYNRKGKRFILFELCESIDWEAEKEGIELKGSIKADEVGQDEEDKANWKIILKDGTDEHKILNKLKSILIKDIFNAHREMMKLLFEFQEEKMPKTTVENKKVELGEVKIKKEEKEQTMTQLKMQYTFQSNPSDIFDCILNQQRVCMYTRAAATIEPKVGSKFAIYNGTIVGEILEVEKDVKIVMKWKIKDWNSFSNVTIVLSKENGTLLKLEQVDIPSNEFERTKNGWKNYYWDPIRAVFGFNYTTK